MTTQRVFRLPQRTSILDLQVNEEKVPEPASQEVLIRIKSIALNFRDFAVATGKYPFPVKDNVVPCSRPVWRGRTGGVSITGLILAKAAGAVTIITSSSDDKLAQVRKTYEVLKITNGHGADFILENGGAGTIAQSIEAVAYGGNIAVIGFLAPCQQDKMPDVAALALSKGAIVRGIMVGSKQQLEDVTRFVTSKNLERARGEGVFGFEREDVVSAFEYLVSGQHIGKVCIVVN
ncbi:unnamed protein product [Alternaria alternata]